MVFHWSLSDSKSPEVSRTVLSTQADLHNAVLWVISACPPISNSSNLFTKTLGIVSRLLLSFLLFFYSFESFFTLVLADGFPLEFKWQQLSSGLQDSS